AVPGLRRLIEAFAVVIDVVDLAIRPKRVLVRRGHLATLGEVRNVPHDVPGAHVAGQVYLAHRLQRRIGGAAGRSHAGGEEETQGESVHGSSLGPGASRRGQRVAIPETTGA